MSSGTFRLYKYNYLWASLAVLVLGALIVWIDSWPGSGWMWQGMYREPYVDSFFCEVSRKHALLRQWSDGLSNLAYLWVGFVVILHREAWVPQFYRKALRTWKGAFVGIMLMLFVGSGFFHASLSRIGERMDLVAVYGMALLPLAFNLWLLFGKPKLATVILSALAVWSIFATFAFSLPSHLTVGLITLGTIFSLFALQRRQGYHPVFRWAWAAGGLILIGGTFFFFDIERVFCDPMGWFQPHAAWHLLGAASGYSYFRFVSGMLTLEKS